MYDYCINCAVSLSENQLFKKFPVIDDAIQWKSGEEIAIIDAILYIYGFSASNLASVYADAHMEDELLSYTRMSEYTENIIEHGLCLCSNCVSVFEKVYVACLQFKKLSSDSALLRKAIKKFSPPSIKIEVDPEKCECITEDNENLEDIRSANQSSNSANLCDAQFPTESGKFKSRVEELFQMFNFEKNNDNEQYYDDDVKPGPSYQKNPTLIKDLESVATKNSEGNLIPRRSKKLHKKRNNCPGSVQRPRKTGLKPAVVMDNVDSYVAFSSPKLPGSTNAASCLAAEGTTMETPKAESLPSVTVKLVRIDEQKEKKRFQLAQNLKRMKRKKDWKKRVVGVLKRKKQLKIPKIKSCDEKSVGVSAVPEDDDKVTSANDMDREDNKELVLRSREGKLKTMKCSCGVAFSSLEALRAHEKRHESQEPVTCNTCGESFASNYLLYIHKNKDHSELPGILFPCVKCGRKFTNIKSLKKHELLHGKHTKGSRLSPPPEDLAKVIYCSCGRPYYNLQALRRHEKSHESLEPVICNVCGRSFRMSYLLYAHKSVEHSEMPHLLHKCNLCDAKFIRTDFLNNHFKQHHSTVKSFICETCGKNFSCRKYLSKHLKFHQEEALEQSLNHTFKCAECGLSLKNSRSLKSHGKRMHGTQETFICHLCGKTTKNMTNMRIHMKVHDSNRTVKTKEPKLVTI